MTAAREAFILPAVMLTVALLGGVHIVDRLVLLPPPLFTLILAVLVLGLLVRSGALAPDRLVNGGRSGWGNTNGLIAVGSLFFATAQVFTMVTPATGLPRLLVSVFFLALLANTLAAAPDRTRVLRSLAVVLGSGFAVKFILLAAVSTPAETAVGRALRILLEGATLGTVTQDPMHPATGYVGFATLVLYFLGLVMLPGRGPDSAMAPRLLIRETASLVPQPGGTANIPPPGREE
jgi:hypothetical protein